MHGHRRNGFADFVFALILTRSCCQAKLARTFDNEEAALKRLGRFLHNDAIAPEQTAKTVGHFVATRLPTTDWVRIAVDWTIEDDKHMLVATLIVGSRGVPIFWRPYKASQLKGKMRAYETSFLTELVRTILKGVRRDRILITADRGFADVALLALLDQLGVVYVIRTKGNIKVLVEEQWRKLNTLRFRTNQRRRAFGKVEYCYAEPQRVFLSMARKRTKKGRWGVWYLVSNRDWEPASAAREYARRWNCESGFRDAKSVLGFSEARIEDVDAWARMFALVAIALLVIIRIGGAIVTVPEHLSRLLRRVRSRRRARSELSLVRAIAEMLNTSSELWEWLLHRGKLNLETAL
jgi:hypothetical protein